MHKSSRRRARRKTGRNALLGIGLLAVVVTGVFFFWDHYVKAQVEYEQTADGTRMKFKTAGETVEEYRDQQWQPLFVQGVNLGATLPGYFPGELPIQRKDYMRWFGEIADMGANVIRVYTIHNPVFYSSLVDYNEKHPNHQLYFIQGIWSPEEQLIAKQDAYLPDIQQAFQDEIEKAVKAVYGDITLPESPGQASGKFTANAGPYLLAWHIGTEWDPEMVANTNKLHKDKASYAGSYFATTAKSTPFEAWLARLIERAAGTEKPYGWQHPMTFNNWVTTDVLSHPSEPLFTEDMVSVDATHIHPVQWNAGYFASYHVYPYYPDFFRYDSKAVVTSAGQAKGKSDPDTYQAYLRKLKAYHKGIPIMVTEYGVPSSLGISHAAPLNRSQGGHNEAGQGQIDADLTRAIHDEGYAGAILFMWQDEWFKKTWNTMPMELPADRRAYWLNVLTNEKQFGLLGMYPGKEDDLHIDGSDADWNKLPDEDKTRLTANVPGMKELWAAHDEAYMYLAIRLDHPFDADQEQIDIGTDSLPGGNRHGQEMRGRTLNEGLETLISIGKDDETEVRIAANYDMEKRLYGFVYGMIDMTEAEIQGDSGLFNAWHLPVSLKMEPPDTRASHPFEDRVVGQLRRGTTDPKDPHYDSLAMWQFNSSFIELRIPWMLLGMADPSSLQAVSYDMPDKSFRTAAIDGIRFIPWIVDKETGQAAGLGGAGTGPYPVTQIPKYTWKRWDTVTYTERLKLSYVSMQAIYKQLNGEPR